MSDFENWDDLEPNDPADWVGNTKSSKLVCPLCVESVPANRMVQVKRPSTHWMVTYKDYVICEMCHMAYHYAGFRDNQIWLEIDGYFKNRTTLLEEASDPVRRNQSPLDVEEIMDMIVDLNFKKGKEIWDALNKK